MIDYKDGTKKNPVKVFDNSEAFAVCRERNRPTWAKKEETGELSQYFPSGHMKEEPTL